MSIERPQEVHPEWCPDCDEEMRFTGMQPGGYAQFFCEQCRYRHDTFVGLDVAEAALVEDGGTADGPGESTGTSESPAGP